MTYRCLEVFIFDVFEVYDDVVIGTENSRLQRFSRHLRKKVKNNKTYSKSASIHYRGE